MPTAHQVAALLLGEATSAAERADRATARAAVLLQGEVARRAPFKDGHLAGSINTQNATVNPTKPTHLVGTNVEYAARHEYGFIGADSLGRVFNYKGQPYFRPSLPVGRKALLDELQREFGA